MNNPIPIPASKSLSPLQLKLQAKLAAIRAQAPSPSTPLPTLASLPPSPAPSVPPELVVDGPGWNSAQLTVGSTKDAAPSTATDRFGNSITYNEAQSKAIELISSGQSCVVIGAAGTGKTTIQKGSTAALIQSGLAGIIGFNDGHKHIKVGAPGILICAYTRRATNNIRKNLSEDLQQCCMTIHKALEYEPVEIYITDANRNEKRSMRFAPTRNVENPLPSDIHTVVIEEASMVSLELFRELKDALPKHVQYVFLGDIQQLPPVFGSAILGYKMLELPVVELTEVYRQALESPILSLAHRILSGKPILQAEMSKLCVEGALTLHPWKKRITPEAATETLAKFFVKAIDQGKYNPETDGILIPFNKSCGTDELNKHIATKLAQRAFRPVHEIIHGWKRSYYSIGDKCLYEKEDAIIIDISENPAYVGIRPREPSLDLNYWGHGADNSSDDVYTFLDAVSLGAGEEDGDKRLRAASNTVRLKLLDSEREVTLKSAGEIDALVLGYAITVHKSQGSEWSKVFLCLHHSHAVMIQRELLYTAVTRAKEELFCICEADTFEKGITRQRIKGNTWQEKAEAFKGKLDEGIMQS